MIKDSGWTPKEIAIFKSQLRKIFNKNPERLKVLKDSKVAVKIGTYKNGKDRLKMHYACNHCEQLFPVPVKIVGKKKPKSPVQVDHITRLEQDTWDNHITTLFVKAEKLQVLCFECHKKKTKLETIQIMDMRKNAAEESLAERKT